MSNKLSLPLTLFSTPPKQRSCGLVRRMPLSPTGLITTSEGLELEVVTSYKYVGVWQDSTLSCSQQISNLPAKVQSRLVFLYCNHSSFNPAAKWTLIQMTILPMLDYGDAIYRSAGKGAFEQLDVLYHSPSDLPPMLLIRHITALYSILLCKLVISV